VSGKGIRVDMAKVQVIQEWARPQMLKEVRSFLGLANYTSGILCKGIPAWWHQ
jgi:hypothetical protein